MLDASPPWARASPWIGSGCNWRSIWGLLSSNLAAIDRMNSISLGPGHTYLRVGMAITAKSIIAVGQAPSTCRVSQPDRSLYPIGIQVAGAYPSLPQVRVRDHGYQRVGPPPALLLISPNSNNWSHRAGIPDHFGCPSIKQESLTRSQQHRTKANVALL